MLVVGVAVERILCVVVFVEERQREGSLAREGVHARSADSVVSQEILYDFAYLVASYFREEGCGDAAPAHGYHRVESRSSGHCRLRLPVPENDVIHRLTDSRYLAHTSKIAILSVFSALRHA